VPLPKYAELHTHTLVSDIKFAAHNAVALALASHALHWLHTVPLP
jgi:hypothetical protein